MREELETGEIDVITGMIYSEKRDRYVDFSQTHSTIFHSIFIKKTDPPIKHTNELKGKEVIVQESDIMYDFVKEMGIENIITSNSPESSLRFLAVGKGDYALAIENQGLYCIEEMNLTNIKITGSSFQFSEYCFATKEGNKVLLEKLNEGLEILKKTEEYTKIHKWLSGLKPHSKIAVYLE
ncbi:MAG: transporter substrate-binding domain-containing protein [Candidatus Cloacimonadota bacterium]|nr:transporter substrate-binding domain-containing protein [Candidatus Cloacimonadota bacterium]